MSFLMNNKSNWIWTVGSYDMDNPCIVYFRKEVILDKNIENAVLKISADSRYRLFINGISAVQGPCKGDRNIWFYDEIQVGDLLKPGVNVFAAVVLRYPENNDKGNRSIWRTETPGFYIDGTITFEGGENHPFITDESWKSFYQDKISIIKSGAVDRIFVSEKAEGDIRNCGWKQENFNDSNWSEVKVYENSIMKKVTVPGGMSKRPIPFMYEKPCEFESFLCKRTPKTEESSWQELIKSNGSVTIPGNTKAVVEISAGAEETGFIETAFINGKGAKVSILYSEAYVYPSKDDKKPGFFKGDRKDHVNGYLEGVTDTYIVGGFGTPEEAEEYEPFWFRTFRFIQITVETSEEPLTISKLGYRETGYPLEVKTKVETSDESLKVIWEISERTLRRCMHETYEDCPFYEQLQYAMDARSQILFTYNAAADDRLARKCIDDFSRSQRYDGLINACYPSKGVNVIPGFAIYYILMIHDHMMYFGDKKLVEKYMPYVERVLQFFDNSLEKSGLVKRTSQGGMGGAYWSFIDWVDTWEIGVPKAIKKGEVTMESLLYLMGLQAAQELAEYIKLQDLSERYSRKAERIKEAILTHCIGRDGLIKDGPSVEEYSQHSQVFAVLTDVLTGEKAKNVMRIALKEESLSKCSIAMQYYLFRALEKTALYDETNKLWDLWRNMIKNNLTTCVENDVDERSDCHAWGALALYELPAVILGVKPAEPGYGSIKITPDTAYVTWAKGEVITPKGIVKVQWEKKASGKFNIDVEAPEGVKYILS